MNKTETKTETKKAVVSFLVAAVVLVSVVGTASAVSITWYPTTNETEVPAGANYWMTRGARTGTSNDFWLNETDSFTWSANESAQCEVSFCAGNWVVHLDYEPIDAECSGYLDSTETVTAKVGILDHSTGEFDEKCEKSIVGIVDVCSDGASHFVVSCPLFTVPQGDYLALRLSMAGDGAEAYVNAEGSATTVSSPTCGDPYPTPELPTLVLFGTGLLALAGFVLYNRRKEDRK